MNSLDACERCGACSWDGSRENPKCPWCGKFKRRGSREELAAQVGKLRHACIASVGFLAGTSILTAEQLKNWLCEVVKETE